LPGLWWPSFSFGRPEHWTGTRIPFSGTVTRAAAERTDLAWGRTALALVVAAAVFLRWMPLYGRFAGALIATAALIALGITLARRRRYRRAVRGISQERMLADVRSALFLSVAVVILAALGIYTVLLLPLH
jgi:uncharacterized membrane protein YidH (DUF202 family)